MFTWSVDVYMPCGDSEASKLFCFEAVLRRSLYKKHRQTCDPSSPLWPEMHLSVTQHCSYPTIWSPRVGCLCLCLHATTITCLPTRQTACRLDYFFPSPFFNICQQSIWLHNAVIHYNWLLINIGEVNYRSVYKACLCEQVCVGTYNPPLPHLCDGIMCKYISFSRFIFKDSITMHQTAVRNWLYSSSLCWLYLLHKAKTAAELGQVSFHTSLNNSVILNKR